MSRLNRVGSEAPVYFPSIVTGSSTQERRFTPIPPQRGRPHSKKHQHGNDSRIQLEPLRPSSSSGTSSSTLGTASATLGVSTARAARVSISLSAENVDLDAKILDGSSTTEENVRRFHAMECKIAFYQQLASLKLREVVMTEQSVLKTIDSVLQACATALDADCVVLYSLNDAAQMLHVTACSRGEAVGFQAPLDKFAMEALVQHVYQQYANGEPRSQSFEPVYLANVQASPSYDPTFDVDSMTGLVTSSILAGVIGDENGKPIFILEARCARETRFSDSVFRAGLATLENIVYQFDLTQVLARTMDMYASLDEILQATIARPSGSSADEEADDSTSTVPATLTKNLNNEADPELEELLLEPPRTTLTELARILLRRSSSNGVCLLKVNPSRQTCEVVASVTTAASAQLVDARKLESLFSTAKSPTTSDTEAPNADPTLPLLLRLVKSFEHGKLLELSDDTDFQSALVGGDFKTVVFVPIPTNSTCSLTGVLFMAAAEHHGYDFRTLRPLTSALELALAVQKRDADLQISTLQKLKLIHLYCSHFEIDTINDPSTLVNMICEIGCETFNTARVTLYVADPIKSELWSLSTLGSVNGLRIPYGTGIAGIVASTKKKLVVLNAYDDPRFDRSFDLKFGFKTESLITFPVLDKNGETLGVIQAVNTHHFMDPDAHPLTAKFDERVLDVFNHMVSHALRVNSPLIMFAKVQSDYWLNRAVMDVKDGDDGTLKSDVASVHYLLDTSGFDEAKRVPRNKWSTFAYACWVLGKFLAARYRMRREKRGTGDELGKWAVDEMKLRSGGEGGAHRIRSRSRAASVLRAGRTNSLINRWRRLALSPTVDEDELLSSNFNPLTKTLEELKQHSFKLFAGLMLISTFRIDESVLWCFINTLAGRYRLVPYHSFYHGFDVALNSYCLIRKTGVITIIKEFEALSLMIAALGHDADHPGNDNQFEIDTNSPLALCYNDISVLENHHASTTFSVLRLDSCNILKDLSASAKVSVRTAIVRCILATGTVVLATGWLTCLVEQPYTSRLVRALINVPFYALGRHEAPLALDLGPRVDPRRQRL